MARTNPQIRYGLIAGVLAVFTLAYFASAHPFSLSFRSDDSRWQVVLDGVMGGLSTGEVDRTRDGIVFHGELSLENNGGFSQIRTPIETGTLSGADGIEIEVRGDGRSYIFDARVANFQVMAGSFQHGFETTDSEWTTVRLAFSDFRFFAFGKRVPGVGAMNPEMVNSLGVTLADYNAGDFELEIRSIRGYSDSDVYERRQQQLIADLGLAEGDEEQLADARAERADRLAKLVNALEAREREVVVGSRDSDSSRVVEICVLAVERGAPLYNHGQPEACAAVYEVALVSISHLGEGTLSEHARSMIDDAIRAGRRMHADDRAWHYRAAIDRLVEMFSGHA